MCMTVTMDTIVKFYDTVITDSILLTICIIRKV